MSYNIAQYVSRLILIELDKKFKLLLENEICNRFNNVELIIGDALKIDFSQLNLPNLDYKIISNLPYNISSQLIFKTFTTPPKPFFMLLMLQKEFATRLFVKGHFLYILAKLYSKVEVLHKVSKNCFWPKPKVESLLVKITLLKNNEYLEKLKREKKNPEEFLSFVKIGFSQRRKKLINNLGKIINEKDKILKTFNLLKISQNIRAEELDIKEWIDLFLHLERFIDYKS